MRHSLVDVVKANLRSVIVPWLIFAGVLAALVGLHQWRSEWFNVWLSEWTASQLAWILTVLGQNGRANGVMVSSSTCSFEIIGECTAFFPAAVLIAGILAYPTGWRGKLWGVGLGLPAIGLLNQVRLVSLCFISRWYPASFEMGHILVWQSLMIFLTLVLWLLWVAAMERRDEEHRDAAVSA